MVMEMLRFLLLGSIPRANLALCAHYTQSCSTGAAGLCTYGEDGQ